MEIVEIITYHLNNLEEVLEVSFRTNSDTEEVSRETKIPYSDIEDFGYEFHNVSDELNDLDEEEEMFDDFEDDDLFVDESEVLSFLNEYYTLFMDKLPKAELF
jgi:hypothetical protein